MKTAVIYARVSSVGDRQNTQRQVDDLNAYAKGNDYEVVKTFEEHISGAKKNSERPVLCECLDYCLSSGIHTLLISELSRLGRCVDEVLENVKRCKDNNLNIYFQKEQLNIFNADGTVNPFLTIMISVLGTACELEKTSIEWRLRSGRQRAIANGVKMGKPKGAVKSREKKMEQYKEAISMLRRGVSLRHVSRMCGIGISTAQRLRAEFCKDKVAQS